MKRRISPKWLMVLGAVGLSLVFPRQARADGINVEAVAVAGIVVLVPLLAFEVFVEAIVLAIGLKVRYRKVLLVALGANVASLVAGIPVKIFNSWMYDAILPRELPAYFGAYPWAVGLGTAIYFAVTVAVEFLVIAPWSRKRAAGIGLGRVALVVLLANAATYAVLAPLHYFATRPLQDIREFTDHTHWAQTPPTTVYYIEPGSDHLCSIATDGQGRRVWVPDKVESYQFPPDRAWFLYRDRANRLCLLRRDGKPEICWQAGAPFSMLRVACDPDGKVVAYLDSHGDSRPYDLVLYDVQSKRTVKTGIQTSKEDYSPTIAWSSEPGVLLLRDNAKVAAYRVGKDLSLMPVSLDSGNEKLAPVYGRFAGGGQNDEWSYDASQDVSGRKEARTEHGLVSWLSVKMDDGTKFMLADDPGLLHLGGRDFGDVCFLPNGNELVFDDHTDLYLLDLARRKVGWIAHGKKLLTPTARYQRQMTEKKE